MRLFRRAKLTPRQAVPARNPLLAVPMIPREIEWGADNTGLIQLRRQLRPKGVVSGRISRLVGFKYASAPLNLDASGSFYWRQVDGRRTLDDIALAFAAHFAVSVEDARSAVLKFTRTLMLRNMVLLEIEKKESR